MGIRGPKLIDPLKFSWKSVKKTDKIEVNFQYITYRRFQSILNNGCLRDMYISDDLPYRKMVEDYIYGN